jgi:hypothetical protein
VKCGPLGEKEPHPCLLVSLERGVGLGRLVEHLGREAVELLRAVDADEEDAVDATGGDAACGIGKDRHRVDPTC